MVRFTPGGGGVTEEDKDVCNSFAHSVNDIIDEVQLSPTSKYLYNLDKLDDAIYRAKKHTDIMLKISGQLEALRASILEAASDGKKTDQMIDSLGEALKLKLPLMINDESGDIKELIKIIAKR